MRLKLFIALVVVAIFCLPAPAAQNSKDNAEAWGKTKWGMTTAEVKETVGGEFEEKQIDGKQTLIRREYPILSLSFLLSFSFGDHGLERVDLLAESFHVSQENADNLIASLSAKYGKYLSFEEVPVAGDFHFKYKWVSSSSFIEAEYTIMPKLKFQSFTVKYRPVAEPDSL